MLLIGHVYTFVPVARGYGLSISQDVQRVYSAEQTTDIRSGEVDPVGGIRETIEGVYGALSQLLITVIAAISP
jgi:hypothetical protein